MIVESFKPSNKEVVDLINRLCHNPVVLDNRCIIRIYGSRGFYAFNTNKDVFNVLRLCVHPKWRGEGIGTLLHLDLLKLAEQHGKKKLQMIIHEESPALCWLRDCWGWRGMGVKQDYFKKRDGYIMEREIV